MKSLALTMILIVLGIECIYSQIDDRRYNSNYMWTSLDENFIGQSLDRGVWRLSTRFKRQLGFLIDSTLTMNVKSGTLELTMQHAPNYLDSLWTTKGWKHEISNYVGAEIVSNNKYQYGVFECKAKFALQSGSWPAFWLFGGDDVPCPPGGHGSEIDIAEIACESDFPLLMHVIHRYYPPENCEGSNQMDKDKKSYHIKRSRTYSTYKCVWTPEKIQYFINDKLMHEVNNLNYEWFPSIPLYLIISQQVTQGFDLLNEIQPVTPQTSYIDWVKVRQFFLAPQITIPDTIPSEGTATLEVDSLASNITWKLTPSEHFNHSEGSGNTAHIIKATNSTGPGKITYSFQMPSGEVYTSEKTFK